MIPDFYLEEPAHNPFYEKQMHNYKMEAWSALFGVVHPQKVEQFAVILAYGAREELPEADMLIHNLGLDQRHIYAVLDQEEEFIKEYMSYEDQAYIDAHI